MSGIESRLRSAPVRYSLPVAGLGLATLISLVIRHFAGPEAHSAVTITYLVAVMACSFWGSYVPGVIACLLGLFAVPYVFTPQFDPTKVDPIRALLVLLVSLLISFVAQNRYKAEAALRRANETLDERVRQRTAELQQSNAELQRLNEDLNQFAYSASHDLQEPLRMIAIYSQMLERKYKGKLSSQADEYITNIVQGAKRMEMLLKDLLVYAKAINAPVENVSPVDINPVLSKALSNLCAAVNESKATIVYGELPAVKIHEVHLLQLFQNLIGNAIKYRSDEPPRVEISATREGRFWSICVKDNGIGVSPEYQEQIFRMFKRLHNADEYEGTGMGLAICQRIVERYGGRIWVESEKGKGSKFCFTAPAADSKMRAANA